MKFMKQFAIIITITFMGEILRYIIPLPIPASIYGLVIMIIALRTRIMTLEKVKDAAKALIEIMPMMFIPAAVGLLNAWKALQSIWIPVMVITVISTIVVAVVSGRMTQMVIRLEKRKIK